MAQNSKPTPALTLRDILAQQAPPPGSIALAPNVNPPKAVEVDKIDFTGRINEALNALNQAANDFENDNGKTAKQILDARLQVNRIMSELQEAEQRLKALQAAGSELDKYAGSVSVVEGSYQRLVDLLTSKTETEILTQWYGHAVSRQAISRERRNDLKLHKKIQDLRQFNHISEFERNATPAQVAKKADVIGGKLVELKAYFEAEAAEKVDQPKQDDIAAQAKEGK
jgi:hypothetical protein